MRLNRVFCACAILCSLLVDANLAAQTNLLDSSIHHDFSTLHAFGGTGKILLGGATDRAGEVYTFSKSCNIAPSSDTQRSLTCLSSRIRKPTSASPNIRGTIFVPDSVPMPATVNGLVLRFQSYDSFDHYQLFCNYSVAALAAIGVQPNVANSYIPKGSAVNFRNRVSLRIYERDAWIRNSIGTASVLDANNQLLIGKPVVDSWAGDKISGPTTGRSSQIVFTQLKTAQHSYIFPKIGFIGDSITAGYNQAGDTITPGQNDVATLTLANLRKLPGDSLADKCIMWNIYDQGVSGSSTANWLPGDSKSLLTRAENAFVEGFGPPNPKTNPVWILLMLGTNDVRSDNLFTPEQHEKNLLAITQNLVGQGYNVIINYPISFVTPTSFNGVTWNAQSLNLLRAYLPVEKAVVSSFTKTHPNRVFMGETSAYAYFARHPTLFQEYHIYGGLHPNGNGGTAALAHSWSQAFARIVNHNP